MLARERFCGGSPLCRASTTLTNNSSASLNLKIIAERFTYHFAVAAWRTNEAECALGMKYWEIIADNLKKAGWSLGYVSAVDCQGRTIWIVDAHRGDGKAFCCACG